MLISNYYYKIPTNNLNNNINFSSNPNSNLLKFKNTDFFININGYGKNIDWANKICEISDETVIKIKKHTNIDKILPELSKKIQNANKNSSDKLKANHTGILRTKREGYERGLWYNKGLETKFGTRINNPYKIYIDKFRETSEKPLKKPYEDISLTSIAYSSINKEGKMVHGEAQYINNALDRVQNCYKNIHNDYIQHPKKVTESSLNKINENIAEIRWLMAHSTPWERGSDSISNVFMRALYKSLGIKTHPAKEGISFDLEAYCTNLADYKKKFPTYFEKPPEIIY